MRVVVLGAGGMLGVQIVRVAERIKGLDVCSWTHQDLDITDRDRVGVMLEKTKPQVLINCAGMVKERTDVSEETFEKVNGLAPQMVAYLCDQNDVRMVQISTDCVFGGDGPHTENDAPKPTDIYGRSKAAGEIRRGRHLTIRCTFVGVGNRGLFAWLMRQKGEVSGFVNVLWNGLTAPVAALIIVRLGLLVDVAGIRHIYGRDTTKYHVLRAANEVLGLGLTIRPVDTPLADFRLRTHNTLSWTVDEDIGTQIASKEFMGDYRDHTSGP